MGDLLLIASLTKTISESGTRNLNPSSIPLTQSLLLQILHSNSLHPSNKIDFFIWCSSSLRHFYKHSACAYSHILRIACLGNEHHHIPNLLLFMKQDGVVADSATFKFLLDAFIRSGKIDFALQILDQMEELEVELGTTIFDPHMYNTVLVALLRKNQQIGRAHV